MEFCHAVSNMMFDTALGKIYFFLPFRCLR
jgi:hypothetical protein